MLEYYNGLQGQRGDGKLFDLKFMNIVLKGVFGTAALSEMTGDIDFNDPKMIFAKGDFKSNNSQCIFTN